MYLQNTLFHYSTEEERPLHPGSNCRRHTTNLNGTAKSVNGHSPPINTRRQTDRQQLVPMTCFRVLTRPHTLVVEARLTPHTQGLVKNMVEWSESVLCLEMLKILYRQGMTCGLIPSRWVVLDKSALSE